MKNVNGIWLPDKEDHLASFHEILDRGTYQFDRIKLCIESTKEKRTYIDVGAHVGLWSMHFVKHFKKIEAFEPIPDHRECFHTNVDGNYVLHSFALGKKRGIVSLKWEDDNTGHTHLDDDGNVTAEIKLLDDFNFKDVDLIKIDVEGYELFVCEGAKKTIKEWKPVICIEQKDHGYFVKDRYAALKYLQRLGYKTIHKVRSDYVLAHPKSIHWV